MYTILPSLDTLYGINVFNTLKFNLYPFTRNLVVKSTVKGNVLTYV